MISVLSLNPCYDKCLALPVLSRTTLNRAEVREVRLGGKGINVARVFSAFSADAVLVGFDYSGEPVRQAFSSLLPCRLIKVDAQLRVNVRIEEASGHVIDINERGAFVTEEQLSALEDRLLCQCEKGDYVALCGSLPPGVPASAYARLCVRLREKGCFVAVDCDGAALQAAVSATPSLIKPNAPEFEALTGVSVRDRGAVLAACRALHAKGVGMVCLSLGALGALLSLPDRAFVCPAAAVEGKGTLGAGDSLLAGLLMALERGERPEEALRFASAVAGASVMLPGSKLCRREDALRLYQAMPPCCACS